jgi:hypothetical protein
MERMRARWTWVAVAALAAAVLAWYAGLFGGLRPHVVSLASRPDVADAFNEPLTAHTDALLMLVSFVLLTPVALGLGVGVIVFAVIVALLITEPALRSLNLPSWTCVPVVLMALGYGAWAARDQWVPQLLYVGGLAAKASLVFFPTASTIPH